METKKPSIKKQLINVAVLLLLIGFTFFVIFRNIGLLAEQIIDIFHASAYSNEVAMHSRHHIKRGGDKWRGNIESYRNKPYGAVLTGLYRTVHIDDPFEERREREEKRDQHYN